MQRILPRTDACLNWEFKLRSQLKTQTQNSLENSNSLRTQTPNSPENSNSELNSELKQQEFSPEWGLMFALLCCCSCCCWGKWFDYGPHLTVVTPQGGRASISAHSFLLPSTARQDVSASDVWYPAKQEWPWWSDQLQGISVYFRWSNSKPAQFEVLFWQLVFEFCRLWKNIEFSMEPGRPTNSCTPQHTLILRTLHQQCLETLSQRGPVCRPCQRNESLRPRPKVQWRINRRT